MVIWYYVHVRPAHSCLPFGSSNAWLELDWICPALDPSRREAKPILGMWGGHPGTVVFVPSTIWRKLPHAPKPSGHIVGRAKGTGGCTLQPSFLPVQLLYHFCAASIAHPTLSVVAPTHPVTQPTVIVPQLDGHTVEGVRPRTTPHVNGQLRSIGSEWQVSSGHFGQAQPSPHPHTSNSTSMSTSYQDSTVANATSDYIVDCYC